MLDVYQFYLGLISLYGQDYADYCFDNWYRFYLACGDDFTKNLSYDRYRMFHHLN